MTKPAPSRRNRLVDLLLFLLLAGVFSYYSLLGATFNGILSLPELLPISVGLLVVLVLWWRVNRMYKGWVWHNTAFDLVFLIWGLAIASSTLLNPETWRRSAQGIWFVLLYIALWYVLRDLLDNRAVTRRTLVNSLLLSGFMVMIFAVLQVLIGASRGLTLTEMRPVSLTGNANAFANIMLVLVPLALVSAIQARNRFERILMATYAIVAIILILLGQSRGAIVALFGALGIFVVLIFDHHEMLSIKRLSAWWQEQKTFYKGLIVSISITAIIVTIGVIYTLFASLSVGGRGLDNRTYLWDAAIQMFDEDILIGKGFFTYGYHLPRFDQIPDGQPQAHAHNLPLTVAAEMGLVGLLALGVSTIVVMWRVLQNWRALMGRERMLYAAIVAAMTGYVVHHLLDTPAMMPLVALIGLILLVLIMTPAEPQSIKAWWRRVGHPIGLTTLWIMLIASAIWHTNNYTQYHALLRNALDNETYFESANQLENLIIRDPQNRAYILQQAYLYGLAANEGNEIALERAIDGYSHYTRIEPNHAQGWSNLAALYYQSSDRRRARNIIDRALLLAPDWGIYRHQRNVYAGINRDAQNLENIEAPDARPGANWARFQYLHDIIETEYLPQVGRGWRD